MFIVSHSSFLWVNRSHRAYTVLIHFHTCPFLSIRLDVRSIVMLACPLHVFLLYHHPCHTCVYMSPNRLSFLSALDQSLPLSPCHVLNPMRRLSRLPQVIVRPRPPCCDNTCIISRPFSSSGASNASEFLHPPLIDHVPRFDWRLRVPSPKLPFSAARKFLAKRTQPPLPTDAYPYNAHIQKYKDQYVNQRVHSLQIYCSSHPAASSPFYHPSVHKMRLSLETASLAGP
jgi:hypothetical protein